MGFFDRFPYSNPYQLNLDWIIAQMKKFESDYNQLDPDSFLRRSGGLLNGVLQMGENGSIDMNGKPLVGLKTAVNSGDALSFGQAEGQYLRKTGDKMSGILDMDGHNITGLEMPVGDDDAATKQYVDLKIGTPEEPGAYLPLAGGMMSGDLNMDGHALTGIQNPINGLDAVNKTYLDGVNGAIRQWALGQFAPSMPDMLLGVEYATAFRYNGKVVYTKLIDIGYGPATPDTPKYFRHNIPVTQALKVDSFTVQGDVDGAGDTIPTWNAESDFKLSVYGNATFLVVSSSVESSDKIYRAQFWYTKD